MTWRWMLLGVFALAWSACVGTPVPEPPAHRPPDAEQLGFEASGSGGAMVIGGPGAAEAGTRLWIAPLDQGTGPQLVDVMPDGSFTSSVFAMNGEELRFQVRSDAGRSTPIDVMVPVSGEIVRPTAGCLDIPLEREVDPVAVGAPRSAFIPIVNDCLEDVVVDGARLAFADPTWAFGAPPFTVPAGTSTSLEVRVTPTAPGPAENVLVLSIASPTPDRRPVSLLGAGL